MIKLDNKTIFQEIREKRNETIFKAIREMHESHTQQQVADKIGVPKHIVGSRAKMIDIRFKASSPFVACSKTKGINVVSDVGTTKEQLRSFHRVTDFLKRPMGQACTS